MKNKHNQKFMKKKIQMAKDKKQNESRPVIEVFFQLWNITNAY